MWVTLRRPKSILLNVFFVLAAAAVLGSWGAGAAPSSSPTSEIGQDDFRISETGEDLYHDGENPATAYNPVQNEFFVVWSGDHNLAPQVTDETEIWGQRIDAVSGDLIGEAVRISQTGNDGDTSFTVAWPDVIYNAVEHEYLVAWQGNRDSQSNELEIFVQRLDASTAAEIGGDDVRISDMGSDDETKYAAFEPRLAVNTAGDIYMVVWWGDDGTDDEYEIYGQRLDETAAEIGTNDFQISAMGPAANTSYGASAPDITYNSADDHFFVVWSGDTNTGGLVDDEFEIFGELYESNGTPSGPADFQISDAGSTGSSTYWAKDPAVSYNSLSSEYLVVWQAYDQIGIFFVETEIFGQRISTSAGQVGTDDFRISSIGPSGDDTFLAAWPDVTFNADSQEYLVVWNGTYQVGGFPKVNEIFGQRLDRLGADIGGDERISLMESMNLGERGAWVPRVAYGGIAGHYLAVWAAEAYLPGMVNDENEIFGQLLDELGETGPDDFRISFIGLDSLDWGAYSPAIAYNSQADQYLVVWSASTNGGGLAAGEFEIWGQLLDASSGLVVRDDFRLSDMGTDGDHQYDAFSARVVYNNDANQFLVVWYGSESDLGFAVGEFEIFGQRLDAGGNEIGSNDFRISKIGADGDPTLDAKDADLVYNTVSEEYLVVWWANVDDGSGEVFGQRLNSSGIEMGSDDFQISEMGPAGDGDYWGIRPAAAHNSQNNEYLVIWQGSDDISGLALYEAEIFGQRLSSLGVDIGVDDFRISDMGPAETLGYSAGSSNVAYHPVLNEYLIVWTGSDTATTQSDIFGQRLSHSGIELGSNDFWVNQPAGPDPMNNSWSPQVAYNAADQGYVVVWQEHYDIPALADEQEIAGQRLSGTGVLIGVPQFQVSNMGPDEDAEFLAGAPALTARTVLGEVLIVWSGNDNTPGPTGIEIFGQRYSAQTQQVFLPIVVRE